MGKTALLMTLVFFLSGSDVEARRCPRRQRIVSRPQCSLPPVCGPRYISGTVDSLQSDKSKLFAPCVCPLFDCGPHPSGKGNLYYAEYWHYNCTDAEPDFLGGTYDEMDLPEECDGFLCVGKTRIFPDAARYPDDFHFPSGSIGDRYCESRIHGQLVSFVVRGGATRYAYLYKYRVDLKDINPKANRDVIYPRFGFETTVTTGARESDTSSYWGLNRYHVTYDGEPYIVLLRPSN